jgi:hypothetical protein
VIRYQHPFVKARTEELTLYKLKNQWLVEMSLDRIEPNTFEQLQQASLPTDSLNNTPFNIEEEETIDSNRIVEIK